MASQWIIDIAQEALARMERGEAGAQAVREAAVERERAALRTPATKSTGQATVAASTPQDVTETKEPKYRERGNLLKRAALIAKHEHHWPTIKRDLQDASENGLTKSAKATSHGDWFEADTLGWARQRGKLTDQAQTAPVQATLWQGLTHKIRA